jgi:hypothetical protein
MRQDSGRIIERSGETESHAEQVRSVDLAKVGADDLGEGPKNVVGLTGAINGVMAGFLITCPPGCDQGTLERRAANIEGDELVRWG